MEGRVNQCKIETTMATVKDLTERRISEMTAIMAQRDKQADERLKCMSAMMHRRDLDVDKRMVDLMATVQDLTLGVKTVAARVPSCPSPVQLALNSANMPSTSAPPSQRSTYREVAQRQTDANPTIRSNQSCKHQRCTRRCPRKPTPRQLLTVRYETAIYQARPLWTLTPKVLRRLETIIPRLVRKCP